MLNITFNIKRIEIVCFADLWYYITIAFISRYFRKRGVSGNENQLQKTLDSACGKRDDEAGIKGKTQPRNRHDD